MRAGRVAALGLAICGAMVATSAFADGGKGGAVGGLAPVGGADQTTAAGGDGDPTQGGGGGAGGGAGVSGGMGGADTSGHQAAGGNTANKNGESGADALGGVAGQGGGGGGGGAHGWVDSVLPGGSTPITGGNGGNGGDGIGGSDSSGGGGGAGGYGAVFTGTSGTLSIGVTGGNGGFGGDTSAFSSSSGDGGSGGVGLYATSVATLTINANAKGGDGGGGGSVGASGFGLGAGKGGSGGTGIEAAQSTALTINAQVTGGRGGDGSSNFASAGGTGGNGGNGGAGIVMNGGGTVTVNAGAAVTGGAGGAGSSDAVTPGTPGLGGAGIIGADLTVINAGSISRGVSGSLPAANAITFTGGTNVYEMRAGASLFGNVVDQTGNGTFRLGGTANSGFDVSTVGSAAQYQGFSSFEKSGTSTWTLTGVASQAMNWTLTGGTLSISNVNSLGTSGELDFNGGILQATQTMTLTQRIALGSGGGGFDVTGIRSLTVDQDITGTGSLTKLGSGLLVLSGTNTYGGATNIEAGTLQANTAGALSADSAYTVASGAEFTLGSGGVIGSLAGAGNVTVNGTSLEIGGDNTSTDFSGNISGENTDLIKTGTGTFTLSGRNSYLGQTIVNDGMLIVNGDTRKSSLTIVNTGATLGGNGKVGSVQISDGGTFAPGNGTPGSSITVASLAMQSGAFYKVWLNPSTSSFANVTGDAALNGATVAANFATASGYVEKQYTILNAGSISGTFDPMVANGNLPSGFKTSLSYDPTGTKVYLDLALDIMLPSSSGGTNNGLPANQSNVGNAITNYFNTHTGIPMAFGGLTPQGLTQVSGEVGTSAQGTTAQANTQFMNVMGDVTSAGRGGAGVGGIGGAMGYADDAMAYAAKKKSKDARDAFASFNKAPPIAFAQRWSVWAMGFGGSQTTDGNATAGTNTSSSNIYGMAVGADYRVGPDTVAGFALAGGGTNYSIVNGGTGRSDLFQAGAFVRQNFGATYLTASAAYGWQDVTTDRYVTAAGVDHLRAEFNTNSYSGRVELGHRFLTPWFGGLGVSPYAAAEVTAFELPSYAERAVSGSGMFALNYNGETSTATRSELGVRTDKSYALEGAMLTLRGRAAWAHNFDPDSAVSATFQSLPGASFLVNGAKLASGSALTTASAELSWTNGWSVAATFEGEFSDVTRSYAGKGVVRYNW